MLANKLFKLVKFDMDEENFNDVEINIDSVSSYVNGYVELIRIPNTTLGILCNEDGMRSNLPPFIVEIKGTAPFRIFGNFLITKLNKNGSFLNIAFNELPDIKVIPDLLYYNSGYYEITTESVQAIKKIIAKDKKVAGMR